ncbi:hypothetical protein BC830DRAFT_1157296 [Chytriomyces sp. MP71]|nr:hypothetical protein BC830DRAFT_1157296 [Chytriomyces sp. MP71]
MWRSAARASVSFSRFSAVAARRTSPAPEPTHQLAKKRTAYMPIRESLPGVEENIPPAKGRRKSSSFSETVPLSHTTKTASLERRKSSFMLTRPPPGSRKVSVSEGAAASDLSRTPSTLIEPAAQKKITTIKSLQPPKVVVRQRKPVVRNVPAFVDATRYEEIQRSVDGEDTENALASGPAEPPPPFSCRKIKLKPMPEETRKQPPSVKLIHPLRTFKVYPPARPRPQYVDPLLINAGDYAFKSIGYSQQQHLQPRANLVEQEAETEIAGRQDPFNLDTNSLRMLHYGSAWQSRHSHTKPWFDPVAFEFQDTSPFESVLPTHSYLQGKSEHSSLFMRSLAKLPEPSFAPAELFADTHKSLPQLRVVKQASTTRLKKQCSAPHLKKQPSIPNWQSSSITSFGSCSVTSLHHQYNPPAPIGPVAQHCYVSRGRAKGPKDAWGLPSKVEPLPVVEPPHLIRENDGPAHEEEERVRQLMMVFSRVCPELGGLQGVPLRRMVGP